MRTVPRLRPGLLSASVTVAGLPIPVAVHALPILADPLPHEDHLLTPAVAWSHVPNALKVDGFIYPLILLGWVAAFVAGTLAHAPTITRTVHVSPTVRVALAGKSGAQIAAALGKPDQTVAGSAISSSLNGLTCGVWNSRSVIICWK